MNDLGKAITNAAATILERLVTFIPSVLGAVALLFAGWVLARLLRAVTARGALLVDALIARALAPRTAEKLRMGRSAFALGAIVYWLVLLFFVAAALHVLGLQVFTDWIGKLIEYLPTFAAGLLIVIAGYMLSGFSADLVRAAIPRLPPAQREVLARVAQGGVLVAAILVGAEQIGIRITFLAIIAAGVFLAVAGGAAIAVSLGARSYVANLVGAHYLRQAFEVGQRLRVAGHEGRVLELNATGMILETEDGRVTLPGKLYHDEPIVLLTKTGTDG
jgi:small-conductance mechanosensitive channel